MRQSNYEYLVEILAAEGVPVYQTRPEQIISSQFRNSPLASQVEEVYQELGGQSSCWNINLKLPEGLETEKCRITIDGPLHFNRYRALSFRLPYYMHESPSWLDSYRRLCRTAERECLKDGSRQGVWTNFEAEKHFGRAQENGDFFGSGAPGWKLQAFRDMLADLYLLQGKQEFKRLSLYDRLMVQRQLMPLQQLLQSRSASSQPYLLRFLARHLGYPLDLSPGAEGEA